MQYGIPWIDKSENNIVKPEDHVDTIGYGKSYPQGKDKILEWNHAANRAQPRRKMFEARA